MYNDSPVVAICGPGLAGKDEVAKWLRHNSSLTYLHSTSETAAPLIYVEWQEGRHTSEFGDKRYRSHLHLHSDRRNHRKFWSDWIDQFNKTDEDNCALYKLSCANGNRILTGIRKFHELQGGIKAGIIDLTIWIQRNKAPFDPTMEFNGEDCDLTIENNDSLQDLHWKLSRMKRVIQCIFCRECAS